MSKRFQEVCASAVLAGLALTGCVLVSPAEAPGDLDARAPMAPLVLAAAPGLDGDDAAGAAAAIAPGASALDRSWQGATRSADLTFLSADLTLDLEAGRVHGTARNVFTALRAGTREVVLGATELDVREIVDGDGDALAFRVDGPRLVVTLQDPLPAGDVGEVTVRYAAQPFRGFVSTLRAAAGLRPSAAASSAAAGDRAAGPAAADDGAFAPEAYASAEPHGLGDWLPTWPGPAELSVVELRIRVGDGMSVVANGELRAVEDDPAAEARRGRVFTWRTDAPIPLESIALAAARLDTYSAEAPGTSLYFHLPRGSAEDAAQRTFGESVAVTRFLAERLGRPFPFPRFDHVVLRELGGPNLVGASLTIVDADEVVTAADELDDRRERPRRAVARGLARAWFGAWIAPLGARQRWLLDGVAHVLELEYEAHVRGDAEVSLEWEILRQLITRQVQADRERGGGPDEPLRDAEAARAGWALRMIRHRIGEDSFWTLLRAFADAPEPRLVTAEDFRRLALDRLGVDLGGQIAQWGGRRAIPRLEVRLQRREVPGAGESIGVLVRQTQPGAPFRVELPFVVHFADGSTREQSVLVDGPSALAVVPLEQSVVDVSIDPEAAVLADLVVEKEAPLWIAQASLARTAVDRLRAIPELARLAETDQEARRALAGILLQSPEPTLREICAESLTFPGPTAPLALERALTEDPSPWVRRAAAHGLLNAFADGRWTPTPEDLSRLNGLLEREPSPAVAQELDELTTLAGSDL